MRAWVRRQSIRKVRCSIGFTLVELLVTIATIAILACVLLPALASAKFQGKNSTCKNNLRQMGIASQMYTSASGFYLPTATYPGPTMDRSFHWDQVLEKYMFPEREVVAAGYSLTVRSRAHPSFMCPLILPLWPTDIARNLVPEWALYGYNEFGIGGPMFSNTNGCLGFCGAFEEAQPESAVVAPSDMIVFGDSFARSLNSDRDGLQQLFDWRPSPNVPPTDTFYIEKRRASLRMHRRVSNSAFCDGHVESENFKKPFLGSDEYLKRWNIDNQPHREAWTRF